MAYWLCITNEDNWKVVKEKNVWGVPERHVNTISRVKTRDRCLIYVKQKRTEKEIIEPMIVAEYEVTSEPFKDSKRIFKTPERNRNEAFPIRIKLKPEKVFKNLSISNLSFLN